MGRIFDKVFKFKPHTDKEKYQYEVIDKARSILNLKTADDKKIWVEYGKAIGDNEWSQLGELEKPLLEMYIEVGSYDVPEDIVNKYPKLKKRYFDKLVQRVNIKVENEIYLTPHEKKVVKYVPTDKFESLSMASAYGR